MFNRALLTLFICGWALINTNAQSTISAGISTSYNIPLETISLGIRANWTVNTSVSISPQLRYSPRFNDFHEFSSGANLHYHFIRPASGIRYRRKEISPSIYALAGIHYHQWINYSVSINERAKRHNIIPEIGLGALLGKGSIKVFLEGKHNSLWMEPSAELGILLGLNPGSKMLKCAY